MRGVVDFGRRGAGMRDGDHSDAPDDPGPVTIAA
jgi:hypothetical protein